MPLDFLIAAWAHRLSAGLDRMQLLVEIFLSANLEQVFGFLVRLLSLSLGICAKANMSEDVLCSLPCLVGSLFGRQPDDVPSRLVAKAILAEPKLSTPAINAKSEPRQFLIVEH